MQLLAHQVQRPAPVRSFGVFEVQFNNARKRGAGRPIVYEEAYGSLYPDGYVHLHTRAVPCTDFVSIGQMREYLESIGGCQLTWLSQPSIPCNENALV